MSGGRSAETHRIVLRAALGALVLSGSARSLAAGGRADAGVRPPSAACPAGAIAFGAHGDLWCGPVGAHTPLNGTFKFTQLGSGAILEATWVKGVVSGTVKISHGSPEFLTEIKFEDGKPKWDHFDVSCDLAFGEISGAARDRQSFTFKTWYADGRRMADGTCSGGRARDWQGWENGHAVTKDSAVVAALDAFCASASAALDATDALAAGLKESR